MWRELETIANSQQSVWLVTGDFNDIASLTEKKGGGPIPHSKIIKSNENINNCHLMDLGSVGTQYTWKGPLYHDGQHIFKSLDRALCNDNWNIRFTEAVVKVLSRVAYRDNHPLLIMTKENDHLRANNEFRFESMWLTEPSYNDLVKNQWNVGDHLDENLTDLRNRLLIWHSHTVSEIKKKKRTLMARIAGIQNKISQGKEKAYLTKLDAKLQEELALTIYQEELVWFQRSRAKWLEGGDRNITYYHLKATTRKKRNQVMALKRSDGSWEEDDTAIKTMVTGYFKTLFSDTNTPTNWIQSNLTYPELMQPSW